MKKIISTVVLCFLLVSCGPPQDGHGTYEYDTGTYVGEFKHGKAHGQGTYTFADGDRYTGEYKDNEYHGQGTYTFASGDRYTGEWQDGNKHGQGTYIWSDGEQVVGEWRNNEFYNSQGNFDSGNTPSGSELFNIR